MGCVLPAGVGQAPARQAALGAGLPEKVECITINKVCGSGLKSVMLAAQAIAVGDADIVVAGGMENMSLAPHYVQNNRVGTKMGDWTLKDGMVMDGLWDPYHDYHMGNAAELCARECKFDRAAQDAFATESYRRAQAAIADGRVQARDRRRAHPPAQGRSRAGGHRRGARPRGLRQDRHAAAGLRQGRHGHGGQRQQHQRRRGGGGA